MHVLAVREGWQMATNVLSTVEAAQLCGVHYTTIRRWVLGGDLPAFETHGGHLRILKEDIDHFISSRRLLGRASTSSPACTSATKGTFTIPW